MIHRKSNRTRGFTLVELLVVVAIIATLMSILLPALNKARSVAKSIACLSGERQIATAINMYAVDFSGFLPQMDKIDHALNSYSMSRDDGSNIWTCPDRSPMPDYVTEAHPVTYAFSKAGLPWVNSSTTSKMLSRISVPSRGMIFADGRLNFSWGAWIFIDSTSNVPYDSFNDQAWFESTGWILDREVYEPLADIDQTGGPSGIRYPHNFNNTTNAVFFDGHATNLPKYGLLAGNFVTAW